MSDLIERQAAIEACHKSYDEILDFSSNGITIADSFEDILNALPSAHPDIDEWCTDCSEYDHDKHCCPRFNRVMRTALEDAQPTIKPKHIHVNLEVTKIGKHVPKFDFDEQPERKTGRWIEMGQNEDGTHNICCGVCGKFKIKSKGHANSAYTKSKYRFCGGCGARMEADADE